MRFKFESQVLLDDKKTLPIELTKTHKILTLNLSKVLHIKQNKWVKKFYSRYNVNCLNKLIFIDLIYLKIDFFWDDI